MRYNYYANLQTQFNWNNALIQYNTKFIINFSWTTLEKLFNLMQKIFIQKTDSKDGKIWPLIYNYTRHQQSFEHCLSQFICPLKIMLLHITTTFQTLSVLSSQTWNKFMFLCFATSCTLNNILQMSSFIIIWVYWYLRSFYGEISWAMFILIILFKISNDYLLLFLPFYLIIILNGTERGKWVNKGLWNRS